MSKRLAYCLVLIAFSPGVLIAQKQSNLSNQESCRAFVQSFYDWYVPMAVNLRSERASDKALRERPWMFSRQLVRQLTAESRWEDESKDAGIDEDPFLNSQDPSSKFIVVKVNVTANTCRAEVRGIQSGKTMEKVLPELVLVEGKWRFVNFWYPPVPPAADNLLSLLRNLRRYQGKQDK